MVGSTWNILMSFVDHITRTGGEPYLTRYRLVITPWLKVFLHRFHAPDGACLHDHPWAWWVSLVLWGGYTEAVHRTSTICLPRKYGTDLESLKRAKRRAGSMTVHRRGHIHRIERLHPTRTTWTLIAVGPHVRRWGFFTRGGWIDHRWYNESRDC